MTSSALDNIGLFSQLSPIGVL